MNKEKTKIIVITGPTAIGKSSLAIDLSESFNGEIVNADSMQVYREMDIGTAKPTIEEMGKIPHHLIDVVNPPEEFNAAKYTELAFPVIEQIASSMKVCFVVGGTGLYIKALLQGLLFCPSGDSVIRKELQNKYEETGLESLYKKLKEQDPEWANKIHPNDKLRIIRALEIIELTKEPVTSLAEKQKSEHIPLGALKICLHMDRERLYHRINKRCDQMIKNGLIEETEALLSRYQVDLKPMQSIGYRHMINLIQGKWGFEQTVQRFQTDTRRYAKRQLTWFRADNEMNWHEKTEIAVIKEKITKFINS